VLSISLVILMSSAAIAQTCDIVHWSGLPKIDRILYKCYPGASPDTIVQEFLDCETDWIEGPGRSDLYQDVIDAGHDVSMMNNMSEFTFAPINCRDYKVSSGDPNAPLNDSSWRLALSYVYGMDDKDTDVFGYYGVPWFSALGNPVPPAQQPWYDEATQMPNTDYETAQDILNGSGYDIADYGGQLWLHKNGVPVRPPDGPNGGIVNFWYSTGAEVYPQGPGGGMVRNWNDFIQNYYQGGGAEGPLMQINPTDFTTLVVDLLAVRDYDIIGIGLTNLGRYVDWIYDCFHSDNDVPWGWNFVGAHDDDYDEWAETILTSMSEATIQEACENWTRKFVNERMDWFPLITGLDFCTTKDEGTTRLTNVISMENYGPRNDLSWMCMHWSGPPDASYRDPAGYWPSAHGTDTATGVYPYSEYTSALGDAPDTMNPWTEDTLYGWNFMDRCFDSLVRLDPTTLSHMPSVAHKWDLTSWVSIPELGIEEGSVATFWLRQDVYWHDWQCGHNDRLDSSYFDPNPCDAYDCVNNMLFMLNNRPGRYSSAWAHLVGSEADGPFKFSTFFDRTSLYYIDYIAGTALLMSEHVGEAIGAGWQTWQPCAGGKDECTYDDLMGDCDPGVRDCPEDYPWLKQLVGTGPYVFRNYDEPTCTGEVFKFDNRSRTGPDTTTDPYGGSGSICTSGLTGDDITSKGYFVSAPVIGSVVGEWRIDPGADYTYEVMIHNMAAKNCTTEGEVARANVTSIEIWEDGVLVRTEGPVCLDPWEFQYLGPYTYTDPGCGPHNITVICRGPSCPGIFQHNYVHQFVVTIREDIGTYCGDNIDFFVDMRDISRAARAFGSFPGHPRWDPCCDVNDDFFVDMRDISAIARKFGWHC
jgi:ABC-type transport system substrate-binding protein